jgi:hypothetical protein
MMVVVVVGSRMIVLVLTSGSRAVADLGAAVINEQGFDSSELCRYSNSLITRAAVTSRIAALAIRYDLAMVWIYAAVYVCM